MKRVLLVIMTVFLVNFSGIIAGEQGQTDSRESIFRFAGPHLFPYNPRISNLRVADVNSDGGLDLVFLNNRLSKVEFRLQKTGQAGGEDTDSTNTKEPNKIEAARLLKEDAFPTSHTIRAYSPIRMGEKTPGIAYFCDTRELFLAVSKENGDWEQRQRMLLEVDSSYVGGFETADLNGDGLEDLVFLTSKALLVFPQDRTDRRLMAPRRYPVAKTNPRLLRLGDISGDGRPDYIYVASGTFYPLRVRITQRDGAAGPEHRFRMPGPRDIAVGEIDGRKGCELVVIESTTNRIKILRWSREKPEEEDEFDYSNVRLTPLPKDKMAEKRDFAIGDVDGNGLEDIIVTSPASSQVTLIRSGKKTGMLPPENFPAFKRTDQLIIAPRGKEGRNVVFMLSKEEKIVGVSFFDTVKGRLTYPQPIDTGGKPLNIALNPGSADRKAGLWCMVEKKLEDKEEKKKELFIVLLTESKGKYIVATETIAPGLDSAPERVLPINLNKDGRVDLMCLRKYESPVLLVQKADGTFENVTARADFRGHILRDISRATVHAAPLKKGTDPLIFVASGNLIRAVAFEKKNLVVKEQFSSERGNAKFAALHIADLDSDGENEILALDSNDDLLNFLDRDEKGIFQTRRKTDVGSFGLLGLVRIDQDGDGQKEIVFVGTKKLGVMSRSASRPRLTEIGMVEADRDRVHYGQVLVGDLNNDGRSDLVLRELAKHQLEIYSYSLGQRGNMNWKSKFRFPVFESHSFRSGSSSQHGQQPRELVLGDVTGDGLTDMAIIVHDRVIVYPQQK